MNFPIEVLFNNFFELINAIINNPYNNRGIKAHIIILSLYVGAKEKIKDKFEI